MSTPKSSGTAAGRTSARRVRYTLDLAREQHRFLKLFALDAEVDASVVMRVLLDCLEQDAGLAKRVIKRLAERTSSHGYWHDRV
jgi:hypothetical protein